MKVVIEREILLSLCKDLENDVNVESLVFNEGAFTIEDAAKPMPVQPPIVNVTVPPVSFLLSKREEVWLRAWTNTANASDCRDAKIATDWAVTCLKEFDLRFSEKER